MRQVSKSEYQQFIASYPRALNGTTNTIVDPPMIGYFDGQELVAKYVSEREPYGEEWWIADAQPESAG